MRTRFLPFTSPRVFLLISNLLYCSCSFVDGRPPGAITHLPSGSKGVTLELDKTVDQQAFLEVQQTPASFEVDDEAAEAVWDRAKFFFEKYVPHQEGKSSTMVTISGGNWGLSSPRTVIAQYYFDIVRTAGSKSNTGTRTVQFSVTCSARTPEKRGNAPINAQNVARFLRDGRLELSLLDL